MEKVDHLGAGSLGGVSLGGFGRGLVPGRGLEGLGFPQRLSAEKNHLGKDFHALSCNNLGRMDQCTSPPPSGAVGVPEREELPDASRRPLPDDYKSSTKSSDFLNSLGTLIVSFEQLRGINTSLVQAPCA